MLIFNTIDNCCVNTLKQPCEWPVTDQLNFPGTYVRVGSTNRRADAELIAEMRRFARGEVFDEPPMPEISSEAVSFRAASESFAAVRRLTKRDLQTLQLLTEYPRLVASCCSATTGCNAFQIPGFRLATSTAPIDPRLPITGNSKAPC
jgi:hypothetical protein